MKIECLYCGRSFNVIGEPFHFVCNCKRVLINFGKQQECKIVRKFRGYEKRKIKSFGNISKMVFSEKTTFFENKYPKKQ